MTQIPKLSREDAERLATDKVEGGIGIRRSWLFEGVDEEGGERLSWVVELENRVVVFIDANTGELWGSAATQRHD